MSAPSRPGQPTQRFLDIAEIRDDLVILKDGTLRAVLLVSSINFALKSTDEQNAIVQAYMQFVNSIDFPIQILIQSRKMNIDKYISQINDSEKKLSNDLLKRQIHDYKDFVKQLVKLGDIMQKRFYVVIPLNPATSKQKSFFSRLQEILVPTGLIRISDERFKKQVFEMNLRTSQVSSGLSSMSLSAVQLDTQSLIELYYNVYNPDLSENEPLTEIERLQLERAP
jgi:type IV secretory pathway VirB4 component